MAS
ncbi:hypothetical protein YPPY47_1499, partial [Yersinia pestis PY-47]|jgi:hypothetical protein